MFKPSADSLSGPADIYSGTYSGHAWSTPDSKQQHYRRLILVLQSH